MALRRGALSWPRVESGTNHEHARGLTPDQVDRARRYAARMATGVQDLRDLLAMLDLAEIKLPPRRLQIRSSKMWTLPAGAIRVGAGTRWANPYLLGRYAGSAEHSLERYVDKLRRDPYLVAEIREHLAGHDLACWCKIGAPCHADVLLRVAAGEEP